MCDSAVWYSGVWSSLIHSSEYSKAPNSKSLTSRRCRCSHEGDLLVRLPRARVHAVAPAVVLEQQVASAPPASRALHDRHARALRLRRARAAQQLLLRRRLVHSRAHALDRALALTLALFLRVAARIQVWVRVRVRVRVWVRVRVRVRIWVGVRVLLLRPRLSRQQRLGARGPYGRRVQLCLRLNSCSSR